jgi:asparagine synthase (glutamine-hydrolysing)
MCGIAGFLMGTERHNGESSEKLIEKMTNTLAHRGPNNAGTWCDDVSGVYFGHRRLSILDLSEAGKQPMESACGRYVITYNGEVYNFQGIKKKLEAEINIDFKTHTDTEVILEACAKWGVQNAVNELIGMFAFSLWDKQERQLTLVRDRIGIKPLYWQFISGRLAFASELKALRVLPDWKPEVDKHALGSYLRHAYVPAPATIYSHVFKLSPGNILTWKAGESPEVNQYWDPLALVSENEQTHFSMSDIEAIDELDSLLGDAVQRRMISDVPLGVMLSGGIDSSIVTALMQKHSGRPVKTFSIGFNESDYNEAKYASQVAKHLGTEHTELYVESKHSLDVIGKIPMMYDEPFADASQIPTFLISDLIKNHVTVALSGDGGDELFAGYTRYQWAGKFAAIAKYFPAQLRNYVVSVIKYYPPQQWNQYLKNIPAKIRPSHLGDKLYKIASILPLNNEQDIYKRLVSQWPKPSSVMNNGYEMETVLSNEMLKNLIPKYVSRMQYMDLVTYLPDDILVKVDRASMAVGLEARVPLLDHRVVEFAWSQPFNRKMRNGQGKWLLKQLLYRYVSKNLVDRPKMGFGVPIDQWLRGPLKGWAHDLLSVERLRNDGFFNADVIQKCLQEHMSGNRNHQYRLWVILMFQAWQDQWV